jgi:hypothetical protein
MRIRAVSTASGKHALQVVSKRYGVVKVHKHIGHNQKGHPFKAWPLGPGLEKIL